MPRELTESKRQEFLATKHVAVLSVAATDGRPPAGVVTLVVQHEEPPYQYVVVEASIADVTDPTPPQVLEGIAVRYLGEEGARQFARSMKGHDNVLFTFRPDRWLSADFSDEL